MTNYRDTKSKMELFEDELVYLIKEKMRNIDNIIFKHGWQANGDPDYSIIGIHQENDRYIFVDVINDNDGKEEKVNLGSVVVNAYDFIDILYKLEKDE